MDDLWNGKPSHRDESYAEPNTNAALTIVRHFDSAAVVKGMVGATPKTIFVLDYALLERLVYLLATGFDVFGDMNHQLLTRIYIYIYIYIYGIFAQGG
jgi:hypothetical protein